MSDDDLTALYAYLMAQPAVRAEVPKTELTFPFSVRPLMAGWNALFHDATPFKPDPNRRPNGTGAPTWCRAWATAAPATRRAMRWGPSWVALRFCRAP